MLISKDEARYCYEFAGYYIVKPPSEFLNKKLSSEKRKAVLKDFEFVSNINEKWVTVKEIREMIKNLGSVK